MSHLAEPAQTTGAPTYPYLCGESDCRERGAESLPMPAITRHWQSHRWDGA